MRDKLWIGLALLVLGCDGDAGNGGGGGADTAPGEDLAVAEEITPEIEDDLPPPVAYAPVVFTVVSDIHVDGGIEGAVAKNVLGLFAEAAAMDPAPELMVVTGDLVDHIPEPADTSPGSRLHALYTIFREGPLPVEPVAGNHDYYTAEFPVLTLTDDRPARNALLEETLGMPPWYVTEHGGTRFIYVNTMQGDLWGISDGLNGSAGRDQLEWLDGLLSEDRPAVLFMHHPPSTVLEDDEISLESTITDHAQNVLAVFAGHLHLWSRSDASGVPIYLTEAGWDGEGIHHVRVDPEARTVEILNEALIDYGEVEATACDPAEHPALGDLSAFEGAYVEVLVTDAAATPEGFGTYLEEAVTMVPMVFRFGAPDPSGLAIPALLTAGRFVGDGAPGKPPYIGAIEGGEALPVSFAVDDPCAFTSPAVLTFDLGQAFGLPLKPGWAIRVDLTELAFEGRLTAAPGIEEGVFHATVDLTQGAADIKTIVISEYCAGAIPGCAPGTGTMPACPTDPDVAFFEEIPVSCDVNVVGIGIRMVLAMLQTVPDYMAWMDAGFITYAATPGLGAPGEVDPALFE